MLPTVITHAVLHRYTRVAHAASVSQGSSIQVFRCSGALDPPIVLVLGVPVFQRSCIMVTGYKHVSWHARKEQWVAQVVAAGKRKKVKALCKYFKSATAAADAVQQPLGLTRKANVIAYYLTYKHQKSLAIRVPFFCWGGRSGTHGIHSCQYL